MINYTSSNFKLRGIQKENKVILKHEVNTIFNTKHLPATDLVLSQNIPSIFTNDCTNKEGLPFREEARSTEIGHLLEHLILEYLKIEKGKNGQSADYSGITKWNWKVQKPGMFNIEINSGKKNSKSFKIAFKKAISLLEKIYTSKKSVSGQEYLCPETTNQS